MENAILKTGKREKVNKKWQYIKNNKLLYVLLLPGLLLTLIFKYFPMYGVLLAFKD